MILFINPFDVNTQALKRFLESRNIPFTSIIEYSELEKPIIIDGTFYTIPEVYELYGNL